MSVDTCPNCFTKRTSDGKFCMNCGTPLNERGNQQLAKFNISKVILIFIGITILSYFLLVDFESSSKYNILWMIVSFFVGAWGGSLSKYFNDKLSGSTKISIFRALMGSLIPILLIYLTLFQVTTVENYEATKISSVTEEGSFSALTTQIGPGHFFDIRIEVHAYVHGDCDYAPSFTGSIILRVENEIIASKRFTSNSCTSGLGVPETGTELAGIDSAFLIEESQVFRNVTVEVNTNDLDGIVKSRLSVYQDPGRRPIRMEFFLYYIIWAIGGIVSLILLVAALGQMRRVEHYAEY